MKRGNKVKLAIKTQITSGRHRHNSEGDGEGPSFADAQFKVQDVLFVIGSSLFFKVNLSTSCGLHDQTAIRSKVTRQRRQLRLGYMDKKIGCLGYMAKRLAMLKLHG